MPAHQLDGIALHNASFNGLFPDERFSTLIYSAARDTNFPANIGSSNAASDVSYSYQLHHLSKHAQPYSTPSGDIDQYELSLMENTDLDLRISNLRGGLESDWIGAQNQERNAREIFKLLAELPSQPQWDQLAHVKERAHAHQKRTWDSNSSSSMIQRQNLLIRLLHEKNRRFYKNYVQIHPSPLTSTADLYETMLLAIFSSDRFDPQTLDPHHTYVPEDNAFSSPMSQYAAELRGATPMPGEPLSQADIKRVQTQILHRQVMTAQPTIKAKVHPGVEQRLIPSTITPVTMFYFDLLHSMEIGSLSEPISPHLAHILRRQCNPATRVSYAQFWILTNQEQQFMAASLRAYLDLTIRGQRADRANRAAQQPP